MLAGSREKWQVAQKNTPSVLVVAVRQQCGERHLGCGGLWRGSISDYAGVAVDQASWHWARTGLARPLCVCTAATIKKVWEGKEILGAVSRAKWSRGMRRDRHGRHWRERVGESVAQVGTKMGKSRERW